MWFYMWAEKEMINALQENRPKTKECNFNLNKIKLGNPVKRRGKPQIRKNKKKE